MKMPRRSFIAGSLAGLGATFVKFASASETPANVPTFDPYELVPLGKTGLTVSLVGLGTGMKGANQQSNQTRLGKEKFTALLRGCHERGIRFFDMADLYGTHPYVLNALRDVPREQLTLSTKIWYHKKGIPVLGDERPDAEKMIERYLKEIGTDYIDLVLLHCIMEENWPDVYENQLNLMAALKKKGVIRAHGISCHSLAALKTAAAEPWTDSVHARLNPYGTKMDGSPEEVLPVLKQLRQAGKGVVGMKLIGEGEFRNSDEKRNHTVDYVLNSGGVDMVIVGFESLEETDDFASRVRNTPKRTESKA